MKITNGLLLGIIVILFVIGLILSDISGTLKMIQEENSLRVTEIHHNNYDIVSNGPLILPKNKFSKP